MKVLWKKMVVALLLALVLVSGVFTFEPVSFIGLDNYGIVNGRNISLTVSARGRQTVSYGVASQVGGVIFQAVAIPAANVEGMPVGLACTMLLCDIATKGYVVILACKHNIPVVGV
jgi:hypothetical protein